MTEKTSYSRKDFIFHLEKEHKRNPLSIYLREIVYGGNDGIITTFAVVAGFAGANASGSILASFGATAVLVFGFANLFADGLSMSLGNFLSTRTVKEAYRAEKEKEKSKILENPVSEIAETVYILKQKGFSEKDSQKLAGIYSRNRNYWVEFMMKNELDISSPEKDNPFFMALATFIAFISFGFIPLFPYLIFSHTSKALFFISIIATFFALFLLGFLRSFITEQKLLKSLAEVLSLGSIAAAAAYVAGGFFA